MLLVDNDRGVREALGCALQSFDYTVALASSEAEALNFLRDRDFDVAFFDLEMPLADGWETFAQIRNLKPLLPIILVTGRSDHRLRAVREENIAVLEKPFDIPSLLEALDTIHAEKVKTHR